MDWIRVDVNLMSHPKLRRLSTRLGCTKAQALGHVVSLWSWACKFSPHGQTDKFEPEEIADGAMWDGDPNLFANAMIEVGLIDDDGMLHDWRQYNGVIIEKKERDRDRIRMIRNTSCDSRATVARQSGNVAVTERTDVTDVTDGTIRGERERVAPRHRTRTPDTDTVIQHFRTAWDEHRSDYSVKYPNVDLNLEWQKVDDWIRRNATKASKRTNHNLFFLSWLAKAQKDYPTYRRKPEVRSTDDNFDWDEYAKEVEARESQ